MVEEMREEIARLGITLKSLLQYIQAFQGVVLGAIGFGKILIGCFELGSIGYGYRGKAQGLLGLVGLVAVE